MTEKFTQYFSSWLASKFSVDDLQVKKLKQQLQKQSKLVYVIRRPSRLRLEVLRHTCRRAGLPQPEETLNFLEIDREQHYNSACLFLRDKTGHEILVKRLKQWRDKVFAILDGLFQQSTEDSSPTSCIPVSFLAGRGPKPWPSTMRGPFDFSFLPLGELWWLFVMLVHRKSLVIDFGEPILLNPERRPEHTFRVLARELYRREKAYRGATIHTRERIESIVLSGKRLERALDQYAASNATSRLQAYARGQEVFQEISSSVRPAVIEVLRILFHHLLKRVFESIDVHGEERLKAAASEHPVVLLPSHRSHFDYIIISSVLYHSNLPLPYIAAGDNLNFFPVGRFLRAGGAFFLRRKIENDILYKVVLERYVTYLVKQGHMIKFYIEGGRSRSGMALQPRLGLLKTLVRCLNRGERRDLLVVPVSITYERLAEEAAFSKEELGESKRRESITELFKAGKILLKKFGPVTVHFGTPTSLKDFSSLPPSKTSVRQNRLGLLTEDLGYAVTRNINELSAITAASVTSAGLLSLPAYQSDLNNILARIYNILRIIYLSRGFPDIGAEPEPLRGDIADSTTVLLSSTLKKALSNRRGLGMKSILIKLVDMGLIAHTEDKQCVEIPQSERLKLLFYTNNLMHAIAGPALLALSISVNKIPFEQNLHSLHQLLKPIMLFPHWKHWQHEIQGLQEHFLSAGWLSRHGSQVSISPKGRTILAPATYLLVPYFDVLIATAQFARQHAGEHIDKESFLKGVRSWLSSGGDFRTEASSATLLSFALQTLCTHQAIQRASNGVGRKKSELYAIPQTISGSALETLPEFYGLQLRTIEALQ